MHAFKIENEHGTTVSTHETREEAEKAFGALVAAMPGDDPYPIVWDRTSGFVGRPEGDPYRDAWGDVVLYAHNEDGQEYYLTVAAETEKGEED